MSPLFKRGSSDGQERTPEERARARAERAAKRAAKRGEPPPDLFDLETAPPPIPPKEEIAEPPPPLPVEAPPPEPNPAPEPAPVVADDPLVAHRPEPQATAEIPLEELPDQGESLLETSPRGPTRARSATSSSAAA